MPLTLILIRHAKSDWGDMGMADHDRPLNARGRKSAPRIGAWLASHDLTPDTVLCSTARRTQETWAGIASQVPGAPAPILTRAIYEAMPNDILNAIRASEGRRLAVIGHNPGIGSLAWSLANTPPQHEKFGLYPTGATTVLRFPGAAWHEINPGQGEVLHFVVPRELPDAD
ncbi:MAG: histidine phosphatase family protein [Pseudomonadota bacterium]